MTKWLEDKQRRLAAIAARQQRHYGVLLPAHAYHFGFVSDCLAESRKRSHIRLSELLAELLWVACPHWHHWVMKERELGIRRELPRIIEVVLEVVREPKGRQVKGFARLMERVADDFSTLRRGLDGFTQFRNDCER